MKVQNELRKILLYDAKINSKLEELERLKALATKVTSMMEGEAVSRTRNVDTLGDTVSKIVEMQNEINKLIDLYVNLKSYYSSIIDELSKPEQITVLYGHYYQGKSFQKIADEMGYSRRNVCYIHGDALVAVEKIIEKSKRFPEIS